MLGNVGPNGNYNSARAEVRCGRGEVALSVGTQWDDDRDHLELSTVYSRLVVDSRGRPKGAAARGASDLPVTRVFTVTALCAKR